MCMGAVALGGVTRLTESGLSMTDWTLLGKPPPRTQVLPHSLQLSSGGQPLKNSKYRMAVSREGKLWPLAVPRGFVFTVFTPWQTSAKISATVFSAYRYRYRYLPYALQQSLPSNNFGRQLSLTEFFLSGEVMDVLLAHKLLVWERSFSPVLHWKSSVVSPLEPFTSDPAPEISKVESMWHFC